MGDEFESLYESFAVAEAEIWYIKESAFCTLHREGDRAAGADCVEAEFIAECRSAQNRIWVGDAAQGAESEQVFVLHAHASLTG